MNQAMTAVIKKDFKGITSNRRLFASLLIVPLALMIILPSIFIFMIHFIPDDPDVQKLLDLIPRLDPSVSIELTVAGLIVNYILPVFFLIIPIMAVFPDHPDHGSLNYGSQLLCRRERETHAGNPSLFSSFSRADFPCKSHGLFPVEHDSIHDLVSRHVRSCRD